MTVELFPFALPNWEISCRTLSLWISHYYWRVSSERSNRVLYFTIIQVPKELISNPHTGTGGVNADWVERLHGFFLGQTAINMEMP
jgi:hypothetical protein